MVGRMMLVRVWVLLFGVLLLGATSSAAQLVPGGRELAVDAGAGVNHRGPALAVGDDGRFATAWLGSCVEMDRCFVLARLLGDDSEPVWRLNVGPATTAQRARVSIAALPGGRFVVAWRAFDGMVKARRFHPDTGPLGPELAVGQGYLGNVLSFGDPGVVAAAGGFVAVWAIPDQQYLRRYTYDGRPVGDVEDLAAFMLAESPSMVARPDGGFVLAYAWEDYLGGMTSSAVWVVSFDAAARQEGVARITSPVDSNALVASPSIALDSNGVGLVVWGQSESSQSSLWARRLRRSGVPDGEAFELPISGEDPSVVFLPGGRFGVAYTGIRPDGQLGAAVATLAHDGMLIGSPRFLADGAGGEDRAPVLVGDGRGRFATGWHRNDASVVGRGLGEEHLFLGAGGRFRASVSWEDFRGKTGVGVATPVSKDTGSFWFFDSANVELNLKVLDGRGANGHFWVFYGSLSNVAFTLTVTDTETGAVRTYDNPLGAFASRGDTLAFPAAP